MYDRRAHPVFTTMLVCELFVNWQLENVEGLPLAWCII